jgi:ABC-type nitrate/sulfonate/bicarbonate transport system substrate-binding protein
MLKTLSKCCWLLAAGALFVATATLTAEAKTIRIFSGSSPIFAPIFTADQQGFLKEEGLDVTVRPFTSGAEATEGFRSGAAEFLVAADVPLIYLLVGKDTAMIAQFSANPDMLLIMGPKGASKPEDLKGKKIGLVTKSASEYLLNKYLADGKLGLTDVERVHLAPFDQVPALARGDVYALSTWKPFDSKIEQVAAGKFETVSYNGKEDYILFSGIVGKRDYLKANPEVAEKLLRALQKASKWLAAAKAEDRDKALAAYLKTKPEDVNAVIANNTWDMKVTKDFTATMASIEEFLASQGLVKNRVDWSSAYDWSYLKRVDAALVP